MYDSWVIESGGDGFDIYLDRSPIFYGARTIEEAEEIVLANGGTAYYYVEEDGYLEKVFL